MSIQITRRAMLGGLALGATTPVWLRYADPSAIAATVPGRSRHLLVVFLRGGNDPLLTVSPMGNAALTKMRPTVALRDADMISLGNGYGINKALPTLANFWRAGQLALIQQVGSTVVDLSHSNATRRWETGSPDGRFDNGWLARYLNATAPRGPVRAAAFGDIMTPSLAGHDVDTLSLQSVKNFAWGDAKLADASARHAALKRFAAAAPPAGSIAAVIASAQSEALTAAEPIAKIANTPVNGHDPNVAESAAAFFGANLGTEISYITLDGFDTHTTERAEHTAAIGPLDTVIKSFFTNASKVGVANDSMALVFSEFGRRVYENSSGGTDHGVGTTVMAIGSGVRGAMYGPALDLSTLQDGNLPVRVDFRSVYASVLGSWFGVNPSPILGGTFPTIPMFR